VLLNFLPKADEPVIKRIHVDLKQITKKLVPSPIWHQRMLFWMSAIIVGAVSVGFGIGVNWSIGLFKRITAPHPLIVFALCPIGLAGVVFVTRRFFPGAQGSGIPQAMAALHMENIENIDSVLSWRIALGKVLLTLVGFLCGASIGKEGPTVQIGCSVMNGLGRLGLKPTHDLVHFLVLAGGAAGIASAFNTPIAGAIFAIEEMAHFHINPRNGLRLLVATALSGVAMLVIAGYYNYFGTVHTALVWGWGWLAVPGTGIVGGILGGLFARILSLPTNYFPRGLRQLAMRWPIMFAALCGLALAIIGTLSGDIAFGSSHTEAVAALHGTEVLPLSFAILKWAATIVSYLSGIPGGIFAPSLAAGAGLGSWFVPLFPHVPPAALAMLGMAAYFSAVVQSPITAAVIVLEMTNNLNMTVAVAGAAALGTAFSRLIAKKPLYAALADQFLYLVERPQSEAKQKVAERK
jgi:H+/Cl- antiporter ClcA